MHDALYWHSIHLLLPFAKHIAADDYCIL